LVVSKVANFAVDLPDANILIQLSGSYGSKRQLFLLEQGYKYEIKYF